VGTFGASNVETTDASGSWSQTIVENCEFDVRGGLHHGPVSFDVIATDAQGAQASGLSKGTCPSASRNDRSVRVSDMSAGRTRPGRRIPFCGRCTIPTCASAPLNASLTAAEYLFAAMDDRLTRRRLLRLALAGAGALAAAPNALAARLRSTAADAFALGVRNAGLGYEGDSGLFATVSPGVAGRDTASVSFNLARRTSVKVQAVRTGYRSEAVLWEEERRLAVGAHRFEWTPTPETPPGSYVMRMTLRQGAKEQVVGKRRPLRPDLGRAPIVRVLGVEAAFDRRSYVPDEPALLTICADARTLAIEMLACGREGGYTDRADEIRGVPMGEPMVVDWTRVRGLPTTVELRPGAWYSGVYAARVTTDDGRVGYAPFVLRPALLGGTRQAVVMPTNTWQAYNFEDGDRDGWGDTWYAGGSPPVLLDRPFRDRGTPMRWRRYDVGFLKWVRETRRTPEFLSDDDLEAMPSGDVLRGLYDLVVFPGHNEYMTQESYDVIRRFRDLGGRLMFLSANVFFWKVDKRGNSMRRVNLWRNLGRPESALIGVQYKANDDGSRQRPFTVLRTADAPWLWQGTGLTDGAPLGDTIGGYGIEIDARTRHSPPGTIVLAQIPDIFGKGLTAEMTYYETAAGARVFAAGALDFGGTVNLAPMNRLLDNLWRRMLEGR
jgi:hypothetical protein